ncbi:MAG: hypothetical protein U0V70_14735 [Terriglobia bacterium]
MNKKFLISMAVIFVLSMTFGFVVHGLLLEQEYMQLSGLFRPPQDQSTHFPFMLLAHLFLAYGFVWIYLQGKEDKAFLPQGICYGIAVAVLTTIPTYLIYYAVQPMPGLVVFKQIVFDTIAVMIMGIVVAWLNR